METILPKTRGHKMNVRIAVMGVSIAEIAKHGKISRQQMYYFLNHTGKFSPDSIEKLCELLGVSESFFTEQTWEGVFSPVPEYYQQKQGE